LCKTDESQTSTPETTTILYVNNNLKQEKQ